MPATRSKQLRLFSLLLMLALAVAALPSIGSPPVALAATTTTIALQAVGINPKAPGVETPITDFKYLIVRDNVGETRQPRSAGCDRSDPQYPANCNWPSIQAQSGYAPIVTQGDQSDFASGGLDLSAAGPGNYMISVTADGYKIDGTWFSLPMEAPAALKVQLNQLDLPTSTLRAVVFNDNAPTNGAPDVPAEPGLGGFRVTVNDTLGEITNDLYGNPICTIYERDVNGDVIFDADGPVSTGQQQLNGCLYSSDGNGLDISTGAGGTLDVGYVAVPNLGPNRYTMLATAPDGQQWIQTATLEGNHDWDTWVQEGSTGFDTEFAVAGEPFPWVPFGFVAPDSSTGESAATSGGIRGSVKAVTVYTPFTGGIPYSGSIWGGLSGAKIDKPIENPWLSLNDLTNGDQAVWVGQGDANGDFYIPNVHDGDYMLTWWDFDQLYLLDWQQVSVKNGQITDVGDLHLTAWYSHVSGRVCSDSNYDGKCQDGEPGIAGFPLAVKRRTNSVIDRGNQGAVTDSLGNYMMDSVYPLTNWIVIEAYSDTYYTTGATYWADNWPVDPSTGQPTKRYIEGAGVDVNFLTVIGQNGHIDWAVQRYNGLPFPRNDVNGNPIPQNGGIVGTVSYDTTRNELNPREAAVENWQVGIPNLDVDLFRPVPCAPATFVPSVAGEACVTNPTGAGAYVANPDGSLKEGAWLNRYVTESWARPTNCQSYDADGKPIDYPALAPASPDNDCLEGPMAGVQFGSEYAAVDGNYGFTDGCFATGYDEAAGACVGGAEPTAMPAGDYLVRVNVPTDIQGRPLYQVTREEDINVFGGDSYTPQVAPPACAGPLHTVDVAGIGADGPGAVLNPTFVEAGGSPFEGMQKPLCTSKLVSLGNGRSIAPSFNFFTEVPIPGRWYGYIVDDLNLSMNPKDLFFGEKAGVPNSPIGVYDYANRLVRTIESDPNGVFEVLLPSTTTINCPTPTGVCANLYRIVGNDPGVPGRLNPNYDPQFRTISATFEIFPGDIEPADLAPTQIGVTIQAPGSQINASVSCRLDTAQPEIFAVSQPYVQFAGTAAARTLTIKGQGFGTAGSLSLTAGATTRTLPTTSWSNNQIVVTVPNAGANQVLPGQWLLSITNTASGLSAVNGLRIHVLQNGVYNPTLLTVRAPGAPILANRANRNYPTIQEAIDAAPNNSNGLVVVFPGGVPDATNPAYNPQLAYFENLIVSKGVTLQGVGPGGVYTDASGNAVSVGGATTVDGSIIDGSAFAGDTPLSNQWRTAMANLFNAGWLGNQTIYEGAVITAVAPRTGSYSASRPLVIDGFKIQGGNQQGFPGNITEIYGLPNGTTPAVETQGGGLYANSYIDYLTVTNNIFQSNGGAYGGAIRIGTPNLPGQTADNQNDRPSILHNRIIANGGTNLAGALGIFEGTQSYDVGYNDFCGNFSAEYGGAIGHYGLSSGGKIHDNRIYFNRSYDEGGAVMIAGELPANPNALSPGAGAVDIYNNLIQANLSNDDGGGLRFLQAGNFQYNVYNNIIANNISTHEGGGVAIDDAPNIRFYNNTVMKNITTATAVTSDGLPAAAGLSTTLNSDQLQATLPVGAPLFSEPLLFNNTFWDNRAGSFDGSLLTGIGAANDPGPINLWDMGVMGGNGTERLSPTNSILNIATGTVPSPSNTVGSDPLVVDGTYNVSVLALPWRTMPGMVGSAIVAVDLPPNLLGNYHIKAGSPAINTGAASKGGRAAPVFDIDNQARLGAGTIDIGADELSGALPPPPPVAFPATGVLDDFNRANSTNLGANWLGNSNSFRIQSNQLQNTASDVIFWNTSFGASQEVYYTFTTAGSAGGVTDRDLLLKATGLSGSSTVVANTALIEVNYHPGNSTVTIETKSPGGTNNWATRGTITGVSFANGDTFGARAYNTGVVEVYKNGALVGSASLVSGANPWPAANVSGGGRIGIWFGQTGGTRPIVDNFGGGTMP